MSADDKEKQFVTFQRVGNNDRWRGTGCGSTDYCGGRNVTELLRVNFRFHGHGVGFIYCRGSLCKGKSRLLKEKKEESYTFRELLQFMRYKPVWALFLVALVVGVGSNIAGGAGAYFYTYILGDMTLMSGVSLVSMITALVGIFLGPILANRFGKKQIFVMAIVVSILFSALRLIDVRSMLLIYISTVAGGVAGGCIVPLTTSIQADNTTYVQYKNRKNVQKRQSHRLHLLLQKWRRESEERFRGMYWQLQVLLPARLSSRRVSIQELSSAY